MAQWHWKIGFKTATSWKTAYFDHRLMGSLPVGGCEKSRPDLAALAEDAFKLAISSTCHGRRAVWELQDETWKLSQHGTPATGKTSKNTMIIMILIMAFAAQHIMQIHACLYKHVV